MSQAYRIQKNKADRAYYNDFIKSFPDYCQEYFRILLSHNEVRSAITYASNLKSFFEYLMLQINGQIDEKGTPLPGSNHKNKIFSIHEVPFEWVEHQTIYDFYGYLEYLTDYEKDGISYHNGDVTKHHKLSALRLFYDFLESTKQIEKNNARFVRPKRLKPKEIIVLSQDEISTLINYMDDLEDSLRNDAEAETASRSAQQRYNFYKMYKFRDQCIIRLLLGTGIRLSELIGLDLSDINFDEKKLQIVRKGGGEDHVFFNQEVASALHAYLNLERKHLLRPDVPTNALFLSNRGGRISQRTVQKMVQKYVSEALPKRADEISVHKLRSSFATEAYANTRDIYAVSKALGHSSLAMVTRYAKAEDQDKKRVAESISLKSQK